MAVFYKSAEESARIIEAHLAQRRAVELAGGDPSEVRLPALLARAGDEEDDGTPRPHLGRYRQGS